MRCFVSGDPILAGAQHEHVFCKSEHSCEYMIATEKEKHKENRKVTYCDRVSGSLFKTRYIFRAKQATIRFFIKY
jgi:hypothetical protein